MTAPASRASSPLRQLTTLAALIEHINASGWLEADEGRRRAVNGPHVVALVRAGARFERGKLVERAEPDQQHQEAAA